jgi:hypothetical protein
MNLRRSSARPRLRRPAPPLRPANGHATAAVAPEFAPMADGEGIAAAPATARPGPLSPAVPLAAAIILALLVLVTLWDLGWLGVSEPSLPASSSRGPTVVTTRRPTFDGKLAGATSATFSITPPVPVRWVVDKDPATGTFPTRPPVLLSPGSYQLSINGEPEGTLTVGQTPQPDFAVRWDEPTDQIEVELGPAISPRWMVEASDADGTYHTEAPVELPPGTYTLQINDTPAQQFTVAKNAR